MDAVVEGVWEIRKRSVVAWQGQNIGGSMCLAITGRSFVRPHKVDAGLDTTGIHTSIWLI